MWPGGGRDEDFAIFVMAAGVGVGAAGGLGLVDTVVRGNKS